MQSEGITPQQKKRKLDKPSTLSGNQDESACANYVGTSNLNATEESDCEQESDNQANEITTKSSLDDIDNLLEEVEDESDSGTDNLLEDIDQYFVPKTETGPKLSDKLATVVNRILREEPDEAKFKDIKEKYSLLEVVRLYQGKHVQLDPL